MIEPSEPSPSEQSSHDDVITPKPIYFKPKTALFLEKAAQIKGGDENILESDGNGFLSS